MSSQQASFTILELFKLGGFFMWPLLLFSIAVVAIAIERLIYIFYHNLKVEDLGEKVKDYISQNDYAGASEYLSGLTKRRMAARVLLTLVNRAAPMVNQGFVNRDDEDEVEPERHFSEHRLERTVETEALKCINSLENGFNFLTALGSLSPLTGFLGTVSGMIGAFRSIAEATEVNAQIVANGIYEALITTVYGLIIAIVAMVAHSIFTHIVDKFAAETEQVCSELITEIADRAE
jgi:biopolymer transport protein ExbB